MADTKLSALTALAAKPDATDEFYINDAGTSKRITYANLISGLLLADGTAPLTANWDVGNYTLTASRLISDVATGTAPLSVSSTTVVSSLNADQVDGNDAADLLARANHTGTQTASTISDFDTEVANNSAVSANTAKVTNATHTGDVSGSGALTVQPAAITGKGSVTAATGDLILAVDVSASPQVLAQVTAQSIANLAAPEGTAILSTGEVGGTKFLREDGDGTCSWAVPAGSGDVSKVGTPVNNQLGVWTGDGTIEGDANLTWDGSTLAVTGAVTVTGNVDGRDVSTDGTKLDGISSGADVTAAALAAAGAITVAGTDEVYVLDVSASPQVLGQTTAQAVANLAKPTESLVIAVSDETTALTTGTAKVTFRMPYAFTLTAVRASVTTAPVGSTIIVDINETGSTLMTTNKLSIDASEKTSTTAATAATLTDTALADDAEITIDIDQVGSSTPGAGLKVYLIGTRT